MSTTTVTTGRSAPQQSRGAAPEPIPMSRIVRVELRKMFDTRAGFWLVAGIGIAAVLASAAAILFVSDSSLTYEMFGSAVGAPTAIILPVVAILAVTSEWSQRSALTTFTLVPSRGKVLAAKATCVVGVALVSMVLVGLVGALGNVVGSTIAGVDTVWDVTWTEFGLVVVSNLIGLLLGFTLGVLLRNSAGAIVGYFVYTGLLPAVSSALASTQQWYRENGPWFDLTYASSRLMTGDPLTTEQWAQLGTASLIWIAIPLAIGVRLVLRSEVK